MSASKSSSPVAVVTGGARGIGLAIGQWFLAHGHQVVLLDIDKATLDATEKTLNRPDDVLCLQTDVSNPEQVQAAAAQVMARFGRVDALVNNAGVAVFKPALETSFQEWRHVLTDRTVVGRRPVTVLVTALDGLDLRLGFDPETRLHMLRPSEQKKAWHG